MRPTTAKLLGRLARLSPCAVISGRGLGDLSPRLLAIPLVYAVGNHGAEWGGEDDPRIQELRARIASYRERLEAAFQGKRGYRIEDKGLSLAVHLRGEALEGGADEVKRVVEPRGPVRVFGGHRVVNIVLADAPHKGTALSRIVEDLGCQAALYVGDDTTDEDAFVNPGLPHFLSMRVGAFRGSQAAYFLESQDEIDDLIEALLAVRLRG